MPYPALPPEPPVAIVASSPAPAASGSFPALRVAVDSVPSQAPRGETLSRPAPPESFEPEPVAATTEVFVEQAGRSSADLLKASPTEAAVEAAIAAPALAPADHPTDPATGDPVTIPSAQPALPTNRRLTEPDRAATDGDAENSDPTDRVANSVANRVANRVATNSSAKNSSANNRADGQTVARRAGPPSDQETELVRQIDNALALEKLAADFAPLRSATDKASFDRVVRVTLRSHSATAVAQTQVPPTLASPTLSQTPGIEATPAPATSVPTLPVEPTQPVPTLPTTGAPNTPTIQAPQPSQSPEVEIPGLPPLITPSRPVQPTEPLPGTAGPNPPVPPGTLGVIEVTADRQEFDEQRKIFIAEGRVLMRFQGALLDGDRVQVNLVDRVAVAEGNVALTRGAQVLRGNRFVYNFVQGSGTVQMARGDIYIPSAGTDLAVPLANDPTLGTTFGRPVSDRVTSQQPQQVTQGPGGLSVSVGAGGRRASNLPSPLGQGGFVNRLRFEAAQLTFTPEGWEAMQVDITNDPFSPPELVLRADRATLTRLAPLRDEVRASRARLVFDQRLTVPLLISRLVLDRRPRQPPLVVFGYDKGDRGGLFIERPFDLIRSDAVQFTLTPQIFVQRMFSGGDGALNLANFGLRGNLEARLSPTTTARGSAVLTSLAPEDWDNKARASLRVSQLFGTHTLTLEASYRDRLYNGSLGFRTVQSSVGAVLTSPVVVLGKTGILLSYQVGYQNVTANTDRLELLAPIRDNDRVNLSRFQAVAAVSKTFVLWSGKALPATPTQGLRYTPTPLVPFVAFVTGLTGVTSNYSNGDHQNDLNGSIGVSAQFGHFSRDFLDYTAFNLSYRQTIGSGSSPFLFDRSVDERVLSAGFSQQIYGPLRFGFQTSINLDNNRSFSTDYILEYSRRTYGITLRYNPELGIGALGLRISDFNWTGGTEPFYGTDITPVESGIRRTTY